MWVEKVLWVMVWLLLGWFFGGMFLVFRGKLDVNTWAGISLGMAIAFVSLGVGFVVLV